MLNIYHSVSDLNERGANIVSAGDDIRLINEINTINEGFVGSVIDEIKAFFRKLKELLLRLYHTIFGGSGSSSSRSSSSSSSGSSSSNTRYSTWTSSSSAEIRRKLSNDYFVKNFRWNLHDWDDRYLDSMLDKINKMDTIKFRMPDGRMINSSTYSVAREISRCIDTYKSSGKSPRIHENMLSDFEDEINNAVERIYDIRDGASYKSLVPLKISSNSTHVNVLTYSDVDHMLTCVETENASIDAIERSYKSLMEEINNADREIQSLTVDDVSPELHKLITALTEALQYKISVLTTLEHIHIKAVRDRSAEYRKELLRFNNM